MDRSEVAVLAPLALVVHAPRNAADSRARCAEAPQRCSKPGTVRRATPPPAPHSTKSPEHAPSTRPRPPAPRSDGATRPVVPVQAQHQRHVLTRPSLRSTRRQALPVPSSLILAACSLPGRATSPLPFPPSPKKTQSQSSQAKTSTSSPRKKKPNRVTWAPSTQPSTPELGLGLDLAIASFCNLGRIHWHSASASASSSACRVPTRARDASHRVPRVTSTCVCVCVSATASLAPWPQQLQSYVLRPHCNSTALQSYLPSSIRATTRSSPWPIRVLATDSPEYRPVPLHHSPCRSQRYANQLSYVLLCLPLLAPLPAPALAFAPPFVTRAK